MFNFKTLFLLSTLASSALAGPMFLNPRQSTDQPTPLTASTKKYSDAAQWSNAVYCNHIYGDVVHGAKVVGAFGDGGDTAPYAFVAYHEEQDKIIVAHQGTDITKLEAVYADFDIRPSFPNHRIEECIADKLSLVHTGFQRMFSITIDGIYSIVKLLLEIHPLADVLITGHSLGAAISVFDLVFLDCHLPKNTTVDAIVFGLPRTGNMPFAESVPIFDSVVKGGDIIAHLPERAANSSVGATGFWSPGRQIWIQDAEKPSEAVICPGLENENCSNSLTNSSINAADHLGNYFGVQMMGTMNCVANA